MSIEDLSLALRDCYDPILRCNIVDLGLVETLSLTLDPDAPGAFIPGVPARYRAAVTLLPASPGEEARSQLTAQIVNRLAGIEALSGSTVTLLDTPAWTPLRLTPTGRRLLGLEGHPHLVQIVTHG